MRLPRDVFDAVLRLRELERTRGDTAQDMHAGIAIAMSGGFGKVKRMRTQADIAILLQYLDPDRSVFGDRTAA